MMKRKLWALALVLSLIAALVPAGFGAGADATVVEYGTVTMRGSNLPWRLYSDDTLVVEEGFIEQDGSWSSPLPSGHRVVFTGPIIGGDSISALFAHRPNVTAIYGLEYFDTRNVTDIQRLFNGAYSIASLDLSTWDVSNVTNMDGVFVNTASLENLNISGWDTSNVRNMNGMFGRTHSLTHLDLSHFNTSNVRNMSGMFAVSNYLIELDLTGWDTHNVTNMDGMFSNVSGLPYLNVSHFDTRNVTNMSGMFNGMFSLTGLDLSEWDTSNVQAMWIMFASAFNLTELDLSGFDTSNVTDMSEMFSGTYALRQLTLGERFRFVKSWREWENTYVDADLPCVPRNDYFTGYWQNVGSGTVDNPQGEFVFTSAELMRYYDGAIHADTWVWQPRTYGTYEPDEINVILNGTPINFDIAPIILDNRTLVPFRAIFEALGMEVEWNNETRTAIGTKYGVSIEIPIDSTIAYVSEMLVTLDVAAMLYNERTMVPLRFVAEATGASVEWVAYRRTVIITLAESQTPAPPAESEIPHGLTEAIVARVIDGDTIVLESGEWVRFIGIDAPEIGEPGADEATEFVRELIDGQTVWLEADGNDTDRFGRLRRYIWLRIPTDTQCEDQIRAYMLNALLLENGLADVAIFGEVRNEALFRELAQD